MGAFGTSIEACSSQKDTDLLKSLAVNAFSHPASAARIAFTVLLPDFLLIPLTAPIFSDRRRRSYHDSCAPFGAEIIYAPFLLDRGFITLVNAPATCL
jgi:hypothetical protein